MIYVKSKREIDIMLEAGKVVAGAHELLSKMMKPGITTIELDMAAEEYIRKKGGIPSFKGHKPGWGAEDYPASVCVSINDEVIHGIPGKRSLSDGDVVSIDVGVYLEGFHGDAARTWGVGQISDQAKRLIDVTKESFYQGMKYAVIGNRISDISRAVQSYVEANGYNVVREYVGHGIGRNMHEQPSIPNYFSGDRGARLQEGMTLAIEPMVNQGGAEIKVLADKWTVVTADKSLSAHYENTIAITGQGPMILTKL